MIVVAIMGILAAVAVSKYSTFQARSRQTEASAMLSQVYVLELAYYGDHNVFSCGNANCKFLHA
jgi:Tfp pilus assembly protein PilE